MRGDANGEWGLIPLAVHEVFKMIEEHSNREFLLRVSYIEIYNEEINDLLCPESKKLQVGMKSQTGFFKIKQLSSGESLPIPIRALF